MLNAFEIGVALNASFTGLEALNQAAAAIENIDALAKRAQTSLAMMGGTFTNSMIAGSANMARASSAMAQFTNTSKRGVDEVGKKFEGLREQITQGFVGSFLKMGLFIGVEEGIRRSLEAATELDTQLHRMRGTMTADQVDQAHRLAVQTYVPEVGTTDKLRIQQLMQQYGQPATPEGMSTVASAARVATLTNGGDIQETATTMLRVSQQMGGDIGKNVTALARLQAITPGVTMDTLARMVQKTQMTLGGQNIADRPDIMGWIGTIANMGRSGPGMFNEALQDLMKANNPFGRYALTQAKNDPIKALTLERQALEESVRARIGRTPTIPELQMAATRVGISPSLIPITNPNVLEAQKRTTEFYKATPERTDELAEQLAGFKGAVENVTSQFTSLAAEMGGPFLGDLTLFLNTLARAASYVTGWVNTDVGKFVLRLATSIAEVVAELMLFRFALSSITKLGGMASLMRFPGSIAAPMGGAAGEAAMGAALMARTAKGESASAMAATSGLSSEAMAGAAIWKAREAQGAASGLSKEALAPSVMWRSQAAAIDASKLAPAATAAAAVAPMGIFATAKTAVGNSARNLTGNPLAMVFLGEAAREGVQFGADLMKSAFGASGEKIVTPVAGALNSAITGAELGSVFGPAGAGVGAVAGTSTYLLQRIFFANQAANEALYDFARQRGYEKKGGEGFFDRIPTFHLPGTDSSKDLTYTQMRDLKEKGVAALPPGTIQTVPPPDTGTTSVQSRRLTPFQPIPSHASNFRPEGEEAYRDTVERMKHGYPEIAQPFSKNYPSALSLPDKPVAAAETPYTKPKEMQFPGEGIQNFLNQTAPPGTAPIDSLKSNSITTDKLIVNQPESLKAPSAAPVGSVHTTPPMSPPPIAPSVPSPGILERLGIISGAHAAELPTTQMPMGQVPVGQSGFVATPPPPEMPSIAPVPSTPSPLAPPKQTIIPSTPSVPGNPMTFPDRPGGKPDIRNLLQPSGTGQIVPPTRLDQLIESRGGSPGLHFGPRVPTGGRTGNSDESSPWTVQPSMAPGMEQSFNGHRMPIGGMHGGGGAMNAAPKTKAVDTTLTPQMRGLLDTIADKESRGSYTANNPGSSAYGRYQFINKTWQSVASQTGLNDKTPINQDKNAAWLAATTYQRKTGRDLNTDLKDPSKSALIATTLRGQWPSLPGGSQQLTTQSDFSNRLATNIAAEGLPGAQSQAQGKKLDPTQTDVPASSLHITIPTTHMLDGDVIASTVSQHLIGGGPTSMPSSTAYDARMQPWAPGSSLPRL